MPLSYNATEINIPDNVFHDDIATLIVTGGSYGGSWVLNVIPLVNGKSTEQVVGTINTAPAPRNPRLALSAAREWIEEVCEAQGMKVAHWADQNDHYSPGEAPFFASALTLVDRRK